LTTSRMVMRVMGTYTLLIRVHAVKSEPDDDDVTTDTIDCVIRVVSVWSS
jgi:hypothetical protein